MTSNPIPAHNWDKYDFGPGPVVKDRLNQGPFPDELMPFAEVVMATTPSDKAISNFGMGLTIYLGDEVGLVPQEGKTTADAIEALAQIPFGSKLYLRVNWKDIQQRRGKLEPCEHWQLAFEMAKRYSKRIGLRVMLCNPNIPDYAVPAYVAKKVPWVKLGQRFGRTQYAPRYDHPDFQSAFNELNALLADAYNGHPLVEYVDTFMYGYWGEGHTCANTDSEAINPFPDYATAARTFTCMLEQQLERWTKTPLATNTQPDCSKVGNAELLDMTVRSHNWLRTDGILWSSTESEQIEALSNRPPWAAVIVEHGMADGSPESLKIDEGITHTDNAIAHVKDIGANYWSLWNWHNIGAHRIMNYYRQYPDAIDNIALSIGYRVRPSWIWHNRRGEFPSLIMGFVNDGISGVPGVLRVRLTGDDNAIKSEGCLDAGYPLPGKVRQAQFILPKGTDWKGLKLQAEIEVKGMRYPIRWACHQQTEADGSLSLRPTKGIL